MDNMIADRLGPSGVIMAQIVELEKKQARAMREFMLGDDTAKARLAAIDADIAALRASL